MNRAAWIAIIALAAAQFLPALAYAKSANGSTVKVISSLKNGDAEIAGSGFLFKVKDPTEGSRRPLNLQSPGGIYLVTSDHVVFQSNTLATHSVYFNETGESAACHLIRSSYELGLALLKCDLQDDGRYFEFPRGYYADTGGTLLDGQIEMTSPWMDKDPVYLQDFLIYSVHLAGYPAASSSLLENKAEYAQLRYKANYPLLMGIDVMYEVQNGHGEEGMSGGLLYDYAGPNDMLRILGIISHKLGDPGSGSDYKVFAIPATDVVGFINDALYAPDYVSRIRREVRHQVHGSPWDVAIGSYDFQFLTENSGANLRESFRIRKIGHLPDHPRSSPRRPGYDFEKALDIFFKMHPDCETYSIGTWGINGRVGNELTTGFKLIQSPMKLLGSLDTGDENVLFLLRCPQTPAARQKLRALSARADALLAKIDNALTRLGHDVLSTRLKAVSADGSDRGIIPPYFDYTSVSDDLENMDDHFGPEWNQLSQQGLDGEMDQIIQQTRSALDVMYFSN